MNQPNAQQGNPTLQQRVRVMQIITAALVSGVVMFAIVVVALGSLQEPAESMMVSLLAAGIAVVAFVMHLVVPQLLVRQQLSRVGSNIEENDLLNLYQTKLIIGVALLEGAAFFNLVACLVEHQWWSLAAAGALAFYMLAALPTQSRVEHWMETQKMLLGED